VALGVADTSGVEVIVGEGPAVGVATIVAREGGSGTTRGTLVVVMVDITVARGGGGYGDTLSAAPRFCGGPKRTPGGNMVGVLYG
jgi:hypothetical protein